MSNLRPCARRSAPARARCRGARGFAALLAALAGVALPACSRGAEERPNVLLITLDTTRADYLGTYGRAGDPTPNLDRLAREGTRFDLAIATAAVTPVSHASILTGLDNRTHGLRVLSAASGFRLPPEVPTLATILAGKGYRTGAIHSAFPVSAHFGLERGFERFESFDVEPTANGQDTWDVRTLQRRSDATTELALDFVAARDRPFFLWLHFWDPHDPILIPPPEYLPADLPRDSDDRLLASPQLYAAEVRYLDHQIGRLLDALRKSGAYANTLVVVVADHGEGLGDHGWHFHRILYQEQIRVPLIVRVPGVEHVRSVPALVSTTDIVPTVLDYLAVSPPRTLDGRSLRTALEGGTLEPRPAFADQVNGYDLNASMVKNRPLDDFLYCVIDAGWKLVYRPSNPDRSELYDLTQDPHETRNVFATEAARREELLLALARHDAWVTAPFPKVAHAANSAGAQRALQGLGYTGDETTRETSWQWTCPRHREWASAERESCPACGSPPILVRAGG